MTLRYKLALAIVLGLMQMACNPTVPSAEADLASTPGNTPYEICIRNTTPYANGQSPCNYVQPQNGMSYHNYQQNYPQYSSNMQNYLEYINTQQQMAYMNQMWMQMAGM